MSASRLRRIPPYAFAHPADRKALSAFQEVPLLPDLLKKVSQLRVEEQFRAHHMYNSIQVGPRQLPSIWRMVHEVSERLGIPPPTTYVSRHGGANAFAFGSHSHSMVLTSGLVDMMSDRELKGIIAHEMGHILCQHMLYMGVGLALTSQAMPNLAKLIPGLKESIAGLFYSWFRAAEFSADRAAVLILEDPEPLARALSRLAGVPGRLEESEFDLRLFAEQVKNFDEEATLWTKIVTFGMGLFLTHPEPAKRVRALLEWAESEEYRLVQSGHYRLPGGMKPTEVIPGFKYCQCCNRPVGEAAVCPHCALPQDPERQQHCPDGHPASLSWKFCKVCGMSLTLGARGTGSPGY
jgi:Zn-dependent protease with chaperone function